MNFEQNTRPTPDRSEARERIATLIEKHVVVTTYRDGTHDLDETLTAADAILATGLVQDEASIRADEREKCLDRVCESLLVQSNGWKEQGKDETATALSNAAVFSCGLERTRAAAIRKGGSK